MFDKISIKQIIIIQMKQTTTRFFTFIICLLFSISVSAQSKLFKDSSIANKIILKVSKSLKHFSGNQTYLYGGIGFNKQIVNEARFISSYNYRLTDVTDNVYKPGYHAGFRFDGFYKLKHKYSFTVGFNKMSSGARYLNSKSMDPFIGEFTNFKADKQLVTLHLAAHYKHLLPIADSTKYKFYLVGGPSIDFRVSKESIDNQVNDNYRTIYLGANLGVEFDNNSYYTLYLHYNRNINSLTKSPIKTSINTFNFGVLLKVKDLF
jgi:hypothetical protein